MLFADRQQLPGCQRSTGLTVGSIALLLPLALSAVGIGSCMDVPADGRVELSTAEFKVGYAGPLPRIQKTLSGNTVRVYLRGSDVTASNRSAKETTIRQAIMAWVDAIRPAAKSALIQSTDVVFDSGTNYDVDVNGAGEAGRAMTNPGTETTPAWMVLYTGNPYEIVLHEFGHVFQLGDTYVEGVWTCQLGEPDSVMCNNGTTYNTLQPDDIAGIRTVFRLAYPDLIDLPPEQTLLPATLPLI
jgi:hypothetical protein